MIRFVLDVQAKVAVYAYGRVTVEVASAAEIPQKVREAVLKGSGVLEPNPNPEAVTDIGYRIVERTDDI